MGWGRPRDKSGLRGQCRGAGAESQGPPAAEGTPWARVGGVGRWQSCSWLGIGAGFLSGREGARRGERGQQQTGTPQPFSLPHLPSAGKAR